MFSKITFIAILLFSVNIFAQATSEDSSQESLYENNKKPLLESELEGGQDSPEKSNATEPATKNESLKKLSELEKLVPFNDVAVIQKRFLPKTGRFEFNPNLGLVTNNAFFMTTSYQARLGYSITEKWSAELIAAFYSSSKLKVTKDLSDNQVETKSLLLPESYYGLDIRWSPIYGKMGVFSSGIVPFDMYFSLGGGMIGSNQDTTPFAIHIGTGQIFALKKWMAFRWDLSGYFYSSETKVATVGSNEKRSESFTDIQLSLGMSFFFPEATYR